jgi:APA family basic amino acid/polyamine antiporter
MANDQNKSPSPTTVKGTFVREATGLTRQLGAKDALMFNLLNMGIPWTFLYLFFAALLFPGVNLPLTVLLGFPLVVVTAITYYYLTSIMPRTGGDFVWVGRIIHPSIGFMNNFALAVFFISFVGPVSGWLFQYGIGTILINLTADTGNAAYANFASQLSGPVPTFIAGIIVLAVITLASVAGIRWAFRFQWVMFGLLALGVLTFLIVMATTSNSQFIANFNARSGLNYASIISTAQGASYNTGITITGTLLGSVYSFLNYYGFNFSTFIAGEVKNSKKIPAHWNYWSRNNFRNCHVFGIRIRIRRHGTAISPRSILPFRFIKFSLDSSLATRSSISCDFCQFKPNRRNPGSSGNNWISVRFA